MSSPIDSHFGRFRVLLLLLALERIGCLSFVASNNRNIRRSFSMSTQVHKENLPQNAHRSNLARSAMRSAPQDTTESVDDDIQSFVPDDVNVGLYRKFVTHAWEKLQSTGQFDRDDNGSSSSTCHYRVAPARGMPNSMVQMTVRSMGPLESSDEDEDSKTPNLLRYARYALLETVPNVTSSTTGEAEGDGDDSRTPTIHSQGIQVLNLVVFPSSQTTLPAWGVDLVSLPGGKHLMLMDVHPMRLFGDESSDDNEEVYPHHSKFHQWHENHILGGKDATDDDSTRVFPWGGDVPDEVSKYVSPYALWTRLKEEESSDGADGSSDPKQKSSVIDLIETNLWEAFCEHLDLYLDLIKTNRQLATSQDGSSTEKTMLFGINDQANYIEYRRTKDPAKPMLNALYGPDFANRILDQVLFPPPES